MNRRVQTVRLYTSCCFCRKQINAADKKMSCGLNCPKRPIPVDSYAEGFMSVNVYEPSVGTAVEFSIATEFVGELFKGVSI